MWQLADRSRAHCRAARSDLRWLSTEAEHPRSRERDPLIEELLVFHIKLRFDSRQVVVSKAMPLSRDEAFSILGLQVCCRIASIALRMVYSLHGGRVYSAEGSAFCSCCVPGPYTLKWTCPCVSYMCFMVVVLRHRAYPSPCDPHIAPAPSFSHPPPSPHRPSTVDALMHHFLSLIIPAPP